MFHWTSSVPSRTVHLTVQTGDGYRCASLQSGPPPPHLTGTRPHVQKSTRIFPSSRGTVRPSLCLCEEQHKPGDDVSGLSRPPLGHWEDPVSSNTHGTSRTNRWSGSWDPLCLKEAGTTRSLDDGKEQKGALGYRGFTIKASCEEPQLML